jgi:hypothetical protein
MTTSEYLLLNHFSCLVCLIFQRPWFDHARRPTALLSEQGCNRNCVPLLCGWSNLLTARNRKQRSWTVGPYHVHSSSDAKRHKNETEGTVVPYWGVVCHSTQYQGTAVPVGYSSDGLYPLTEPHTQLCDVVQKTKSGNRKWGIGDWLIL